MKGQVDNVKHWPSIN